MPTQAKKLDTMAKHLTEAEIEAREAAESGTIPSRPKVMLKPPTAMKGDKAAMSYWRATLKRMEGLSILDDLDSESLGIYCTMLSRRDDMQRLARQLLTEAAGIAGAEERLEAMSRLDRLLGKLQGDERSILQYADKLGLTPSGRVRLAQTRAKAAAAEIDPDGDLFGD